MDSGDGAVGVVFNFDGGNLISAISAMRQQLVQLGYIYREAVQHASKAVDGITSLMTSLEGEYAATVANWENEGGR